MMEFTVAEILEMQRKLQERYRNVWSPLSPETGQNQLLWMVGEIGEVIDIVKKNGGRNAVENPDLKAHLVEEMTDVLMYYGDVMLCYGISEDELKQAYIQKFEKNMTRWEA